MRASGFYQDSIRVPEGFCKGSRRVREKAFPGTEFVRFRGRPEMNENYRHIG